jgi:4-hydroxy-tetrahydrodipicolinate reductase
MSRPAGITSAPVRIAILGIAGRMGRALLHATLDEPGARLTVAVGRQGSLALGQDAGVLAGLAPTGVLARAELPSAGEADVWIDFSVSTATAANAQAAAVAGAALVVGTTGVSPADEQAINRAADRVAVLFSPNLSVGANVLLTLVADAARALGPEYEIEILEAHHRRKSDSPSGTALRLARAVAEATGRDLARTARYERHGETGERTSEEIGLQTVRGGDVVGDHTVFFLGVGDRMEMTHRASSRDTFAYGAVRAALWLSGRSKGLYDMGDVLSASDVR